MDLVIRKAITGDIPQILRIWLEFMAFLAQNNPDYWMMTDGEHAFSKHLKISISEPQTLIAVAEVDEIIVGFCLAYIEQLPEWFGAEKVGLIRYLAISQDYRQQGFGKKLVSYMLGWFRHHGIERVEVFVLEGIPASSFWDKLRFKTFMDRRFLLI